MKFFMDTNFILIPEKFGLDVFEGIAEKFPGAQLATVKPAVNELRKMNKKLALAMLQKFKVEVVDATGNADTALLNAAAKELGVVCTNDIKLKKRCLKADVPVVFLRNKKTLEMKGGINV